MLSNYIDLISGSHKFSKEYLIQGHARCRHGPGRSQTDRLGTLVDFVTHLRALAAHPCWGVHWQPHVNLSMNFGKPRLTIREPKRSTARSKAVRLQFSHRLVTVRGDWWLWLFSTRW